MQIVCKRQNLLIANGEFFNFLVCIYITSKDSSQIDIIQFTFLIFSFLVDVPLSARMMFQGIESRIIMQDDLQLLHLADLLMRII